MLILCHTCCLPNQWVGIFVFLYIWTVVWKTAVMTQYEQSLCETVNTRETCDYMPKMGVAGPTVDHTSKQTVGHPMQEDSILRSPL